MTLQDETRSFSGDTEGGIRPLPPVERAANLAVASHQSQPADLEALLEQVDDLTELGRHEEVLRVLDAAKPNLASDSRLETARGWALENLGAAHLGPAAQAYGDALELDPDNLEAREGLANVRSALGDTEAANRLYRDVVERVERTEGPSPTALELQGWCLYKLKDLGRSVEAFSAALTLDDSLVAVRFDLGLVLFTKGEIVSAVLEYGAGMATLQTLPERRRTGALAVAIEDLEAGMYEHRSLRENSAVREIRDRLSRALYAARSSSSTDSPSATASGPVRE